jgi:hypothetical protein
MQAIGVLLLMAGYVDRLDLILRGSFVLDNKEWWRLLSFMMIPKTVHPIWLFFAFYIFYLMGSALEQQWGTFRYNMFILCGYLFTVATAFISPGAVITNFYFLGCVFLAFATLFPNFELRLFFILPVKMKWLGWLTFGLYILTFFQPAQGLMAPYVVGNKLGVLAAFVNYALFFGNDVIKNIKAARRRQAFENKVTQPASQPFHVCFRCGVSDQSDEKLSFRYCSTCGKCFCENHIADHDH